MGKWAQYSKRGRAPQQGTLLLPASGWYTVTSPSAGNVTVTKVGAYPPGATDYRARAQLVGGGGTTVLSGVTTFGPATINGLSSGALYNVTAAWYVGQQQVSEWSLPIVQMVT